MQISWWKNWSEHLWEVVENKWISRNGQDHFYRIKVVIPAIEKAIRNVEDLLTVIDLGCGDAFVLNQLLKRDIITTNMIRDIILIDRSNRLLKIAQSRIKLPSARAIKADLDNDSWVPIVKGTKPNKLFLSIFLIQEMPRVDNFFSNLYKVFKERDLGLFITVAPSFAHHLISTGKMHLTRKGILNNTYFRWAAAYPVAGNSRPIHLPYFHRTRKEYEEALNRYGMKLIDYKYLSVPSNKISWGVFENTLYGEDIINRPSSLLLIVKKK